MEITTLTAQILGIYLVVSGLFIIIRGKSISHLLKDFFDHPAIVYLTGVILIFLSSIYLLQYSAWNSIGRSLTTLFVWIVMLKGLSYLFFPQTLSEITIKKFKNSFNIYGLIAIVIGLYLFF